MGGYASHHPSGKQYTVPYGASSTSYEYQIAATGRQPNPVVLSRRPVAVRTENKVNIRETIDVTGIPGLVSSIVDAYLERSPVYNAIVTIHSPDPIVSERATNDLLKHRFTDVEVLAVLAAYAHVSEDVVNEIFETNTPNTLQKWTNTIRTVYSTVLFTDTSAYREYDELCIHGTDEQFKQYLSERTLPLGLKAMIEILRYRASKMKSVNFDFESYESNDYMQTFAYVGLDLFAPNVEVVVMTFPRVFFSDNWSMVMPHRNLRAHYELHFDVTSHLPLLDITAVSFRADHELDMQEILRDLEFVKRSMWTSWLVTCRSFTVPETNVMRIGLTSVYPALRFDRRVKINGTNLKKWSGLNGVSYEFASSLCPAGKTILAFEYVYETGDAMENRTFFVSVFYRERFIAARPANVREIERNNSEVVRNMTLQHRVEHFESILNAARPPPPNNPLLEAFARGASIAELNESMMSIRLENARLENERTENARLANRMLGDDGPL